ncbi:MULTISPECIES: hypothetical protein [unclassified Rhizobium]|uniref:hypothetical protein n=1 Tax=unclassified Rhizobium TaxID=2613769 RepID=UPI0007EB5E3A|nr:MULTISPECIES: hypothetical protein [unclassified Rhizobium]ANK87412.1 hypothetical protein AMK02_CH03890 [Rhizobium sp. N731]ANL17658.1 hypothetical protein AMJ97_CH03888 [Rhizobium sp. N1314]
MPYPILTKAEARTYLLAVDAAIEKQADAPEIPATHYKPDGPDEDWDDLGKDVAAKLEGIIVKLDGTGDVKGSEFEVLAGPVIHALLPEHPALADPEFWVWVVVAHCEGVVRWRYPKKGNLRNFGIGGGGENLLYRLWLRAEIGYAPGAHDPYELALVGDIDFWRSHIFRQSYGEVRHFARALIEFQFPAKMARKSHLKINQIRLLAKQLKRARSNLLFELMSQSRATQFIESEWERLASETA